MHKNSVREPWGCLSKCSCRIMDHDPFVPLCLIAAAAIKALDDLPRILPGLITLTAGLKAYATLDKAGKDIVKAKDAVVPIIPNLDEILECQARIESNMATRDDLKGLESRLNSKVSEMASKEDLKRVNSKIDDLQAEVRAQTAELQVEKAELRAQTEDLKRVNSKIDDLQREFRAEKAELRAQTAELQAEKALRRAERAEFRAQFETINATLVTLSRSVEALVQSQC